MKDEKEPRGALVHPSSFVRFSSCFPDRIMNTPLATHDYAPGGLDAVLEFLKRTRSELRMLRKVRIWKDHLHIIDVNKDYFEVRGVGYLDPDIVPILRNINTAFNHETIYNPIDAEYKEFDTGKRRPWAEDRVM